MSITSKNARTSPSRQSPQGGRPCTAGGGFTIIEIIVVVLILAILVALIGSVGKYIRDESTKKTTANTLAIIMNAVNAYYDNTYAPHQYPPDTKSGTAILSPPWNFPRDCGIVLQQYLTGRHDDDWDGDPEDIDLNPIAPVTAAKEKLRDLPREAFGESNIAFMDSYEQAIRYNRDGGLGGKPVVISAGPDGKFGTNEERGDFEEMTDAEWEEKKRKLRDDNVRSDGR